jgi:branched-chain amino acid aminotransferase
MVRGGVLITPGPATDILEGITRSSILQIAKDLNVPIKQRSIDRSELYIADEMFMCGSSARLTPVLSVDKRQVGSGRPGAITKKISELYKEVQDGSDTNYSGWRTAV